MVVVNPQLFPPVCVLSARARMRLGWTQLLGRARLALAAQKQAEAASPASRHRAGKLKRVEAQLRANMAAAEDKLSKLSQVGTCADVPAAEEPAGTPPRTHSPVLADAACLPPQAEALHAGLVAEERAELEAEAAQLVESRRSFETQRAQALQSLRAGVLAFIADLELRHVIGANGC
jgi:hypothetical protein